MDYEVREILNPVGSGRFEVKAKLIQNDPYRLRLGHALIERGAIKHSDFLFRNINNEPHVIFKISNGTPYEAYPLLAQAQGLFTQAVANALKIRAVVQAISLADSQGNEEESR